MSSIISALPAAASVALTDLLPTVVSPFGAGTNRKATVAQLATAVAGVLNTTNTEIVQVAVELDTSNATPTTIGATFELPTDSLVTVDAQVTCIEAGAAKAKVFNVRRHLLNDSGVITAPAQVDVSGPDEIGGALAGLGMIEAHGTGNLKGTENGWYDVNQDVLVAAGTYNYRVVATNADGAITYGSNQTVVVP